MSALKALIQIQKQQLDSIDVKSAEREADALQDKFNRLITEYPDHHNRPETDLYRTVGTAKAAANSLRERFIDSERTLHFLERLEDSDALLKEAEKNYRKTLETDKEHQVELEKIDTAIRGVREKIDAALNSLQQFKTSERGFLVEVTLSQNIEENTKALENLGAQIRNQQITIGQLETTLSGLEERKKAAVSTLEKNASDESKAQYFQAVYLSKQRAYVEAFAELRDEAVDLLAAAQLAGVSLSFSQLSEDRSIINPNSRLFDVVMFETIDINERAQEFAQLRAEKSLLKKILGKKG